MLHFLCTEIYQIIPRYNKKILNVLKASLQTNVLVIKWVILLNNGGRFMCDVMILFGHTVGRRHRS